MEQLIELLRLFGHVGLLRLGLIRDKRPCPRPFPAEHATRNKKKLRPLAADSYPALPGSVETVVGPSNSLDRCYGFCVPEPGGICGAGVVDGGAVATGLVELSGLFAMPAPVVVDVVPVFEAVDMPLFDNP